MFLHRTVNALKHSLAQFVQSCGLTQCLSGQNPAVLADHGPPGVPLAGVLDEGVALVHRAAQHAAVLGEDALHVRLLHHGCVQVANEHPRVDGLWIRLVGHVAGLDLQRHAGEMSSDGRPTSGWVRLEGRGWERRGSEDHDREEAILV